MDGDGNIICGEHGSGSAADRWGRELQERRSGNRCKGGFHGDRCDRLLNALWNLTRHPDRECRGAGRLAERYQRNGQMLYVRSSSAYGYAFPGFIAIFDLAFTDMTGGWNFQLTSTLAHEAQHIRKPGRSLRAFFDQSEADYFEEFGNTCAR